MWSTYKSEICYADCTVLHLDVNRPSQFSPHNLNIVDCTHKLTVLGEFKLTGQADIDQNLNRLFNSTCRHIKFESTALKGLTAGLCNFHSLYHFQISFCRKVDINLGK